MNIKVGDIVYNSNKNKVWYILSIDEKNNSIDYIFYFNEYRQVCNAKMLDYWLVVFLKQEDIYIQSI